MGWANLGGLAVEGEDCGSDCGLVLARVDIMGSGPGATDDIDVSDDEEEEELSWLLLADFPGIGQDGVSSLDLKRAHSTSLCDDIERQNATMSSGQILLH